MTHRLGSKLQNSPQPGFPPSTPKSKPTRGLLLWRRRFSHCFVFSVFFFSAPGSNVLNNKSVSLSCLIFCVLCSECRIRVAVSGALTLIMLLLWYSSKLTTTVNSFGLA